MIKIVKQKKDQIRQQELKIIDLTHTLTKTQEVYLKYKQVNDILKEIKNQDWTKTKTSPCVASSAETEKKLKKINIASIQITGISSKNTKGRHRVNCILIEPQTGEFMKLGEFEILKIFKPS